MYAGRRRRKAAQSAVKKLPAEGAKSNPSKRHRDRLNSELERLAGLLPFPQEVTASLDKLSILRLSVSYLRAKNFFSVALNSQNGANEARVNGDKRKSGVTTKQIPEGELLLQALNGIVLVITASGTIFYCSHTIEDYLGFHQTDVMHQNVYELVHTEDQQELRRNLHWALNPLPATVTDTSQDSLEEMEPHSSSSLVTYNPKQLPPENSSFLERSFVCRFRCLLDNSTGFLALNIQGRLKFLYGQNQQQDNGGKAMPQLALFAIATPLQSPAILEIRTKNMIFRTKHKLDFTPMACDAKGKIVLGYTEAELRVRGSGYQFIHAADMLYCAENHVRMIKTGESGLTVFRLLTKENRWKWVQANARLVYKNGKPDYIIATQRPLLDEEGGEHLRKRSMHLPFTYATGEALLYQSNHPIAGFDRNQERNSSKSKKCRSDRLARDGLDPGSLLGALMSQDESVYVSQPAPEPKISFQSCFFGEPIDLSYSEMSRQRRSWSEPTNGVVAEPSTSFDPLLATLDSLSLDTQDVDAENGSCSNSELFLALEGLGLSAEDLELLLLDERMIKVEIDPEHVPTLDELLTNDEILSYIHESIEGKPDSIEHGGQLMANTTSVTITTGSGPENNHTSGSNLQVMFAHCKPFLGGQGPILQLSQQMQQHLNTQAVKVANDWRQHSGHMTNEELLDPNLSVPNEPSTAQDILVTAGIQLEYLKSQPDGELQQQQTHQHYLQHHQGSRIQKQLSLQGPSQQKAGSLNESCGTSCSDHKSQWQDLDFVENINSNSCFDNKQKLYPNMFLESYTDYSVPDNHNADYPVSGSDLFERTRQQDEFEGESTIVSLPELNHKQHLAQIPEPLSQVISSLSQHPPANTSLEEILGGRKLGHKLDQYNTETSEICYDSGHSKVEQGCILNSSYPEGCAPPNGNEQAPTTVQMPGSETLSGLPGPQETGFYL